MSVGKTVFLDRNGWVCRMDSDYIIPDGVFTDRGFVERAMCKLDVKWQDILDRIRYVSDTEVMIRRNDSSIFEAETRITIAPANEPKINSIDCREGEEVAGEFVWDFAGMFALSLAISCALKHGNFSSLKPKDAYEPLNAESAVEHLGRGIKTPLNYYHEIVSLSRLGVYLDHPYEGDEEKSKFITYKELADCTWNYNGERCAKKL